MGSIAIIVVHFGYDVEHHATCVTLQHKMLILPLTRLFTSELSQDCAGETFDDISMTLEGLRVIQSANLMLEVREPSGTPHLQICCVLMTAVLPQRSSCLSIRTSLSCTARNGIGQSLESLPTFAASQSPASAMPQCNL